VYSIRNNILAPYGEQIAVYLLFISK